MVDKLSLDADSCVLDLCCGQGELAKGFSPYIHRVLAVDRSAAMLDAARVGSPANIVYLEMDVGADENQDFGEFDLVTVGRGLEYLPREQTLKILERSLRGGGYIFTARAEIRIETPWRREYGRLRRSYGYRGRTTERKEGDYFAGTAFEYLGYLMIKSPVIYDIDALMADAMSYPSLHASVSQNLAAFRSDLEALLRPYRSADGTFPAIVGSGGCSSGNDNGRGSRFTPDACKKRLHPIEFGPE